jgi:phosphoribosylaminoimidazole (AIR) synthetase
LTVPPKPPVSMPSKKAVMDVIEVALSNAFPNLGVTRGPAGLGLVDPGNHANGFTIPVTETRKIIEAKIREQEKKQNAAAKRATAAARKSTVKKPPKRK